MAANNKFYHPKFIPTWIILIIMRLVVFIPFSMQYKLSWPIGLLLRILAKKKYHVATVNISKCFPKLSSAEQKEIVDKHFTDFAMSLFEVANCFYMSKARLKKLYQLDNLELLERYTNNKENVMIIVGHFTTMIIAGRILADNIQFADIYRPQNNKLFNHTMVKMFKDKGVSMIDVRDNRSIIRTLKNGTPIWYAPDQDLRIKKSVFADFFGVLADTITSTSKLAKSSNAKVVHFNFYRHNKGYHCSLENIDNYPSNDDMKDATTINQHLERQILQAISQYLWTHKRFKSRPNNEASFYKK